MKIKSEILKEIVSIIVMVIIITLSVVQFVHVDQVTKQECWEMLKDCAMELNTRLTPMFAGNESGLRGFAQSAYWREISNPKKVSEVNKNFRIGSMQTGVRLYLSDGSLITEFGTMEKPGFIDYSSIASEKPYYTRLHMDRYYQDEPVIEQFYPIIEDGKLVGMASTVIKVKEIPSIVDISKYNGKIKFALVDRNTLDVFVDTYFEQISNYNDKEYEKLTILEGGTFENFKDNVKNGIPTQIAFKNKFTSRKIYMYVAPSNVASWTIAILADENVVFSKVNYIRKWYFGILFIEFFVFSLYFWWLVYLGRKQDEKVRNLELDNEGYKMAILSDAYSYFKVNLTKNKVIPPVTEKVDGKPVDYSKKFGEYLPTYDDMIYITASTYVDEKYRDSYIEKLSRQYLIQCFKAGNTIPEYYCRIFSTRIGWHYRKYTCYLSRDIRTGNVYAMFVAYDVTKSMQQEAEKQENFRRVMNLSDDFDAIYDVDLDTGKYAVFKRNENKTEYLVDNIEQTKNYYQLNNLAIKNTVYTEDQQMMRDNLSKENLLNYFKKENAMTLEYRVYDHNDASKILWFKMRLVRVGDWTDRRKIIVGVINNNENWHKEKEFQEKLQDALSKAQSANRAKTTFLNNMSHDIRTPMNAILGFTSIASKHLDDSKQVGECLEKITESSDHLLSLINDVLDMSYIESGKMSLNIHDEKISEMVETLENIAKPDAQMKEIDFKIHMENITNNVIVCDKLRLKQVLLNIISNAIKYTKFGGYVDFSVTQLPNEKANFGKYEFRVKDNGIGMSKEYQKILFDPFTREKSGVASEVKGSGLGMAITKKIVDMMGGTIEVQSELGKGSEFVVVFDFPVVSELTLENDTNEKKEEKIDLSGMKVLLVDDNDFNREIASIILTDEKINVTEAVNGKEAFDKIQKSKKGDFDLVLMDVQMPILNGYESTKLIRALENKDVSDIPIIAMTANAFEEDKKAALNCGMNDHIAKPIDIGKLKTVLAKYKLN